MEYAIIFIFLVNGYFICKDNKKKLNTRNWVIERMLFPSIPITSWCRSSPLRPWKRTISGVYMPVSTPSILDFVFFRLKSEASNFPNL